MNETADLLKKLLADTFAFYLKTHYFHWNIEGPDFPQYHDFLNNLYQDVYGAVDPTAELIRSIGEYAPGSFSRYSELTTIKDSRSTPPPMAIFSELYMDNMIVLQSLNDVYDSAERNRYFGVSNFIQARIEQHMKHKWMLNSIIKRNEQS